MSKTVHIIGGGTVSYIRPHLALSAPAYGATVRDLLCHVEGHPSFDGEVHTYTTKMAGDFHWHWRIRPNGEVKWIYPADDGEEDDTGLGLETNEDIEKLLDQLIEDPEPKIIFLPAALCDFKADGITYPNDADASLKLPGKHRLRLKSDRGEINIHCSPAEKIIRKIRKTRKDIFLVGFKTTTGADYEAQFTAGLKLLKTSSCNLVLANDLFTRLNMIITPEQAAYGLSKDRGAVLEQLVDMALTRSEGRFTRSEVKEGELVKWDNTPFIPNSLRTVVEHCIKRGAYKPFLGATVGHFAHKVDHNKFVTSRRGVDFNKLSEVGMVLVIAEGEDRVLSYGAKPSVGGQSQRIIFEQHPEMDCIVHFHCPLKPDAKLDIPITSQAPHECGSHGCGENTSKHLRPVDIKSSQDRYPQRVKAVMLDKHGPNIVFNQDVDPQLVINFIEENWDLERSTSDLPL